MSQRFRISYTEAAHADMIAMPDWSHCLNSCDILLAEEYD